MQTPETKYKNKTSSRAVVNNIKVAKSPNLKVLGIQAKLTIGKLGDKSEQKADRVANKIMSMPASIIPRQPQEEEE